jgi:hypothetical protein
MKPASAPLFAAISLDKVRCSTISSAMPPPACAGIFSSILVALVMQFDQLAPRADGRRRQTAGKYTF